MWCKINSKLHQIMSLWFETMILNTLKWRHLLILSLQTHNKSWSETCGQHSFLNLLFILSSFSWQCLSVGQGKFSFSLCTHLILCLKTFAECDSRMDWDFPFSSLLQRRLTERFCVLKWISCPKDTPEVRFVHAVTAGGSVKFLSVHNAPAVT